MFPSQSTNCCSFLKYQQLRLGIIVSVSKGAVKNQYPIVTVEWTTPQCNTARRRGALMSENLVIWAQTCNTRLKATSWHPHCWVSKNKLWEIREMDYPEKNKTWRQGSLRKSKLEWTPWNNLMHKHTVAWWWRTVWKWKGVSFLWVGLFLFLSSFVSFIKLSKSWRPSFPCPLTAQTCINVRGCHHLALESVCTTSRYLRGLQINLVCLPPMHFRDYWLLFNAIISGAEMSHSQGERGEDSLSFYTNWWLYECDWDWAVLL